jgi:hypothetical protein
MRKPDEFLEKGTKKGAEEVENGVWNRAKKHCLLGGSRHF